MDPEPRLIRVIRVGWPDATSTIAEAASRAVRALTW
jgi:hypothetical protein